MNRKTNTASYPTDEEMTQGDTEVGCQILQRVLDQLESNNYRHGGVLTSDEEVAFLSVGLLQPYTSNPMLGTVEEQEAELTRLGKVRLLTKHGSRCDTYTIEIAALRNLVEKLDGKQVVSSNDSKPDDQAAQGKETHWQGKLSAKKPAFRVALPSDTTVSMEVKVLEPVRKASKQLAAARGMTAQQLMEHLLVDALNKSPEELEHGKKRLQEFKGSTQKARRFAEREELARLRQLHSTPSH